MNGQTELLHLWPVSGLMHCRQKADNIVRATHNRAVINSQVEHLRVLTSAGCQQRRVCQLCAAW